MSATSGHGGCGCGSAAAASGGGCGSAGTAGGCGCASATDAYVRPQFFAGQLLTEEDLGLLVEYVTAKNRLHNRSFFGTGVVCGLQVGCHPCGGGRVIVRPGHALDCCGNDIVVPCQEELDVNAMIHALRIERLGGHDCGDSCDQPKQPSLASGRARTGGAVALQGENEQGGKEDDEGEAKPLARRYSLYVSYCETASDPVAPYATGEPCGDGGCQPTRVREGYRFELRCPTDPREPDDRRARVQRCLAELREFQPASQDPTMWRVLGQVVPSALRIVDGRAQGFHETDAAELQRSVQSLSSFVEESSTSGAPPPDPETVRAQLDDLRALVMTSARLNVLGAKERAATIESHAGLDAAEADALEVAKAAAAALEPHIDEAINEDFARASAYALVAEAPRFADAQQVTQADDPTVAMAMMGVPATRRTMSTYLRSIAEQKEWLLTRLDGEGPWTDCGLRRDVERIDVSQDRLQGDGISKEVLASTGTSASELAAAFARYISGCMCAAHLPPCSDCDDAAVLLAAIEVQECEVANICNLERTIPLTGTALGYWLPVQHLARELEKGCCELPRLPEDDPEVPVPEPIEVAGRWFRRPTVSRAPEAALLRTAGLEAGYVERLSRAMVDVSTVDLGELSPSLATATAAAEPTGLSQGEVEGVAAKAAAEAVERDATGRLDKLEERLKDVTALKRDIATLRRRSDDLKQRNAELEKSNRAFAKRLDSLGGGG
jgi:hypothetical protein